MTKGLDKIIIHWTAGAPVPNTVDKEHYHFIIDQEGKTHIGNYKPEDNINCKDGRYARHTGGGNTGAIGVSLCGMKDFKGKDRQGPFPITRKQFEAAMKLISELASKYEIKIDPEHVMTHYEFGESHRDTTSHGKIDITFIPSYPWIAAKDCGPFIRSKIRWYQANTD